MVAFAAIPGVLGMAAYNAEPQGSRALSAPAHRRIKSLPVSTAEARTPRKVTMVRHG
jgi:hypothetical protein